MRRTTPVEPVEPIEPAPPLSLFRTQSKDGTPKGLTLNPNKKALLLECFAWCAWGDSNPRHTV